MKKNLSLLATLALAAALSPATFAQQEQTAPPASDPQTQTAPPASDSQTQAAPAPDTTADQAPTSFSGKVAKCPSTMLSRLDSMTYQLDDQVKAKQFSGKQVNVMGTLDKSTSVIRVSDIQPAS